MTGVLIGCTGVEDHAGFGEKVRLAIVIGDQSGRTGVLFLGLWVTEVRIAIVKGVLS